MMDAYSSTLVVTYQEQVFFGTPHRAVDLSSWENLILNIALVSLSQVLGKGLFKTISAFSKTLADLSTDFHSIATAFRLVNIYEDETEQPGAAVSPHLYYQMLPGNEHHSFVAAISKACNQARWRLLKRL